jgi:hypothetical protein
MRNWSGDEFSSSASRGDKSMKMRGRAAFDHGRKAVMILLSAALVATLCACATVDKDQRYQPLAATAGDLARAVMRFANQHPTEAAALDDQELVRQATAYDPRLLEPYAGLVVRGTVDGVILVCEGDGKTGLFEDAECTDIVDKILWLDKNPPCRFTLKCE